jgi:hypothetical protein
MSFWKKTRLRLQEWRIVWKLNNIVKNIFCYKEVNVSDSIKKNSANNVSDEECRVPDFYAPHASFA